MKWTNSIMINKEEILTKLSEELDIRELQIVVKYVDKFLSNRRYADLAEFLDRNEYTEDYEFIDYLKSLGNN